MLVLKHRKTGVTSLAFSPDGETLAAGCYWGYVQLWHITTRSLVWEAKVGTLNHSAIFFHGSDRVVSFAGQLYSFDVASGDHARLPGTTGLLPLLLTPGPAPVTRYCTAYNGRKSFSCYTFPERRRLWNANLPGDAYAGIQARRGMFTPGLVSAVAFSGDGASVAAGCITGEAHVLRADTGKPLARILDTGRPAVRAVALSPDGSRLAFSAGAHLFLYRVSAAPEMVKHVSLGRTHFVAATWHPSGAFFATVNGDGKVDLWDATSAERRTSFGWGVGKLDEVVFDADGGRAAVCSDTGEIVVWDIDH